MTSQQTVEERLTALETEIADLKQQLNARSHAKDWIQQITGIMSDDPEGFAEMVKYGREWRESYQPDGDEDLP